jgi:hypothetical protein
MVDGDLASGIEVLLKPRDTSNAQTAGRRGAY